MVLKWTLSIRVGQQKKTFDSFLSNFCFVIRLPDLRT